MNDANRICCFARNASRFLLKVLGAGTHEKYSLDSNQTSKSQLFQWIQTKILHMPSDILADFSVCILADFFLCHVVLK